MATKAEKQQGTSNRLEAMRHPVRAAALRYLNTHGLGSPQQIANAIGAKVTDVSYHMRRLEELDCAEMVRTEPVRGVVRHIYRPVDAHVLEAEEFGELPDHVRWSNVVEIIQLQAEDCRTAVGDGTLAEDPNIVLIRLPLRGVDREGQLEIRQIMEETYRELQEVPARCLERRQADSGEEGFRMSITLNAFEVSSF
jgi:Helix-turn-helix domain